jgi:mannosyltransferase
MAVDSLRSRTPPPLPATPLSAWRSRTHLRPGDLDLSHGRALALVALLTIASALLRIGRLRFHYWVDEGIAVGVSSHPLSQLPALLREDGSPPLYYLLLHVWMQLFGRGEVATHELSLAFALLTIPTAYWAGTSLFGRKAGLYCAVLAAGVPFLTTYAQETRMYSLLLLGSLIVAASFVHVFVFRRRRYLPVFAVSLAASLYTHNWALFLGLGAFLAFLFCLWTSRDRRALGRDGALAFGAVAVLYLPWLSTLLYQAQHTGAPWALAPTVWSLPQGAYFLVGGRGPAVALLLAAGSGLAALRPSARDSPTSTAIASLLVLGLGTLIVAWLYAKTSPAWANRYLAVIVGPSILLVGLGLARAARLGTFALVLVCCFWVLDPTPVSVNAKSNVAAAASVIRAQVGTNALVLSTQPEQVPTLAYYLPRVTRFGTPLGPVPDPRVVDWRNALSRLRQSSVGSVLVPMLGSMAPGERLVFVQPASFQKAPAWLELIHRATTGWLRYLEHDPQFRLLRVTSPHDYGTGVNVRMLLYVKRG